MCRPALFASNSSIDTKGGHPTSTVSCAGCAAASAHSTHSLVEVLDGAAHGVDALAAKVPPHALLLAALPPPAHRRVAAPPAVPKHGDGRLHVHLNTIHTALCERAVAGSGGRVAQGRNTRSADYWAIQPVFAYLVHIASCMRSFMREKTTQAWPWPWPWPPHPSYRCAGLCGRGAGPRAVQCPPAPAQLGGVGQQGNVSEF